ncbi:hypothetical protein V0288_07475 [Pannus brasiliensis CCIBt3594]|uniref:SMI1/KNR4 family protein n=1 Tax=Pannus brasiliensis CCIBt3594 TaxID=1427578 RepID=A0AAW9QSM2_9CHRO
MSSPVSGLANHWEFTEIRVDPTSIPPYVLMLLGDEGGNYCIFDPSENYKIVFASSSYKEAKLWFLEDEYERVEGRLTAEKAA